MKRKWEVYLLVILAVGLVRQFQTNLWFGTASVEIDNERNSAAARYLENFKKDAWSRKVKKGGKERNRVAKEAPPLPEEKKSAGSTNNQRRRKGKEEDESTTDHISNLEESRITKDEAQESGTNKRRRKPKTALEKQKPESDPTAEETVAAVEKKQETTGEPEPKKKAPKPEAAVLTVGDTTKPTGKKKRNKRRENPLEAATIKDSTPTAPHENNSLEELSKAFYQRHYDALHKTPSDDMIVWMKHMDTGMMLDGFWNQLPHYVMHLTGSSMPRGKGVRTYRSISAQEIPNQVPNTTGQLLHFERQNGLCDAAKFFDKYRAANPKPKPWPHVTIAGLNRDFGALSTSIKNYTNNKNHRLKEWKELGCSSEMVQEYINHPETLAVITSQFHMWDHPKAHSIPLGFHREYTAREATKLLNIKGPSSASNRPQLVMINFNANNRYNRKRILQHIQSPAFSYANGTQLLLHNTYVRKGTNIKKYFEEVVQSKFILSPGGWGFDCYRNWESLFVGTIPVMEHLNRQDGWYRTFDDLPVAWIDHLTNVTPAWLEEEYRRIVERADTYNWEKLTRHYWHNWVLSFLPRCANQQCQEWIGPDILSQMYEKQKTKGKK